MSIDKLMCKVGVVVCTVTSAIGCGGHDMDGSAPPYRVVETSDDGLAGSDGGHRRAGLMTVVVGERARVLRYQASRTPTDGGSETSLTISDTTDGSWSRYTLDEGRSVASIVSASGRTDVSANPDGSVTVNGTTFNDPSVASDVIVASAAVAPLSAEMLAAADYALDRGAAEPGGPRMGTQGFWKKVKRFIGKVFKGALRRGVQINRSF